MNDAEIEQVHRLQQAIDALTPVQREVLKAWVNASYDDNGNWIQQGNDHLELTILAFQDQIDVMEEQVASRFSRDSEQHQVIQDLRNMLYRLNQINGVRNDRAGPNPPLTPKQAEWYWDLMREFRQWQPRFESLMQQMNEPQ